MNRILVLLFAGLVTALSACASEESVSGHGGSHSSAHGGFSGVVSPNLPDKVEFAGQTINLDRVDMFERMDRELTSVCYTHGTTMLIIKRANKYFPIMAPILRKNGVPEDLLYLACVESSLNQRAYSPASAAGMWQFIPSTAKEYGLEVNEYVDERYNIEKATAAACRYFKKSLAKYGNWESVAASYNGGMGRISRELDAQGARSSFDLYLTEETSRYMFRILALKILMENPADYGFYLTADNLYYPVATKAVEVSEPIEDLPSWAKSQGTDYAMLRELNPWLRAKSLPNKSGKSYRILVPENSSAVSRSKHKHKKVFNEKWIIRN